MRGMLYINNLQNVVKVEDAMEAKLREKYLEVLSFEWADHHQTKDSDQELRLLDSLAPNTSLIKFNIIRYGGEKFPDWVGHHSFCNIVDLVLSNCKNCVTLPPLGQLSNLKKLGIREFEAVVTVGAEFYGSSFSMVKPFASLEELNFSDMKNWKKWMLPNEDVEVFPKLKTLFLGYCDNLIGDMPCFLPSLIKLTIYECQQLASTVPRMPNAIDSTLTRDSQKSYNHLQSLDITRDSLSLQFKCLPSALKTLRMTGFKGVKFQLQQKSHDSLEEISLRCSGFWRLSFALDLFPNIRRVHLSGCENVESLWVSSNGLSIESPKSLSALSISNCPGSTLSLTKLPNLTSLEVSDCNDLKFLPQQMHNLLPSLQSLRISGCQELESFPAMGLPSSLRNLTIAECDKLVASRRNWNLQRLPNMTSFNISDIECEAMESFPEEGLLPSSVSRLRIQNIGALKVLHNEGLQKLTSLKELTIDRCPKLEMMTEEALPATISSLFIDGCPLMEEKCKKDTGEYWNKIAHIFGNEAYIFMSDTE